MKGRPPKRPEDVRSIKVQIRLTVEERKVLIVAASAAKTNVSDFCRTAALEAAKKTTSDE